jgi:tripartite-type tricarboxylate transporter receptor subunit TctC
VRNNALLPQLPQLVRLPMMRYLALRCVAVVLFSGSLHAHSTEYPNRPIRFIVPYPPGGGTDVVARVVARRLADELGQPIVIDNRGGANAIVGTQTAARAAADGYTILLGVPASLTVNPLLHRDLPYDPVRDFSAVAQLTLNAYLLTAHPTLRANTVRELIDLARLNPGSLNFGSSGNGSAAHLMLELFKRTANVDIVHVPYKGGGPALNDLLAGQIQLMGGPMISALSLVTTRRLKGIAVTTANRIAALPDVPTIAETVPGYELSGWSGVLLPAKTPQAVIQKLNRAIERTLQYPEIRRQLGEQGSETVGGAAETFSTLIHNELKKYRMLLQSAGITRAPP